MYALMDALGPVVVIYFVLLVLVGAFFVVNLVVAVIYQAYVTTEAGEEAKQALVRDARARCVAARYLTPRRASRGSPPPRRASRG